MVFPSSAYDPLGNDLVRTAKPRGIKTLFLIDNWDNLSWLHGKSLPDRVYGPNLTLYTAKAWLRRAWGFISTVARRPCWQSFPKTSRPNFQVS